MMKINIKIIIPLIISVIVIVGITVVLTAGKSDKDKAVLDGEVLMESTSDIESDKTQVIIDAVIHDTTAGSEEITVQNTTTNKETILKDETSSVEEITPEPETEPATEPSLERETETESHSSEYEQEITTPQPTEVSTAKPTETVTQPPTTEVHTTKEPETTPKPTEPPTTALKENVYVFNDDGTINFKESKINNYDLNSDFIKALKKAQGLKEFVGIERYNKISKYAACQSGFEKPKLILNINDEYLMVVGFDENWNPIQIKKGSTPISYDYELDDGKNLPIIYNW